MLQLPQHIIGSEGWIDKLLTEINFQVSHDPWFMSGQGMSHLAPFTRKKLERAYRDLYHKLYLSQMAALLDLEWDECLMQVCLIPPKPGSPNWKICSDDGFAQQNYKGAQKLVQAVEENRLKQPA